MRLKKLCESHCEDFALNLVTSYMRCCDYAESHKIYMSLTDHQMKFILDVYIALLYKFKKTYAIVSKVSLTKHIKYLNDISTTQFEMMQVICNCLSLITVK